MILRGLGTWYSSCFPHCNKIPETANFLKKTFIQLIVLEVQVHGAYTRMVLVRASWSMAGSNDRTQRSCLQQGGEN